MKIDIITAEIGSTTTVINALNGINTDLLYIVGQGRAVTTVHLGDVTIGINNALENLKKNLNVEKIDYEVFFATSSAAGGLKMTVHGLVYDMTVRAAKEAALGAGANIHLITAGKLRATDIEKLKEINPDIILLAGGVDYGERETAIYNAKLIAKIIKDKPIIYAGNIENKEEMKKIFAGNSNKLYIAENVYPIIDELNVEPTRKMIQEVFEEHITKAPGMEKVRNLVNMNIMPTPGAVMLAAKLLESSVGDLAVIDVGGATTDIHSVTEGSEQIQQLLISTEPKAKRTVEGDLGVYINRMNLVEEIGKERLAQELQISMDKLEVLLDNYKPIPETVEEIELVRILTMKAIVIAMKRHVGEIKNLYGPTGKRTIAKGKDLTNIKYLIGTGGAITRLSRPYEIMEVILNANTGYELLPDKETKIWIDSQYIMASIGMLSIKYPEQALKLLLGQFSTCS